MGTSRFEPDQQAIALATRIDCVFSAIRLMQKARYLQNAAAKATTFGHRLSADDRIEQDEFLEEMVLLLTDLVRGLNIHVR